MIIKYGNTWLRVGNAVCSTAVWESPSYPNAGYNGDGKTIVLKVNEY